MFSRRMLFFPLVAAAAGVPYMLYSDGWKSAQTTVNSWIDDTNKESLSIDIDEASTADVNGDFPASTAGAAAHKPPLEGTPVRDLREILSFDVSKAWITNRWARVTTTLSELEYEGMRVAVVTGPKLDDIAGSLTYYFDHQQRVRRITLDGMTGDPRRLVALAQQHFGFRAEPTLHAGLYLIRWNGTPRSALLISQPAVITADAPRARYHVKLEINQPGSSYQLSNEFSELLQQHQQARR